MKRAYELGFVVRVEGGEDAINEAINQVQAWVETDEHGQVMKIDRWGRRKLAYEIDNQRDGYYVFMQAGIEPSALPELERNMKLANSILRYLIIVQDESEAQ
jgi:small subunit ribosomal protein S6